jgi:hypothetical protein
MPDRCIIKPKFFFKKNQRPPAGPSEGLPQTLGLLVVDDFGELSI